MSGLVIGKYVDSSGLAKFVELAVDGSGCVQAVGKLGGFDLINGNITAAGQTVVADVSSASNVVVMMKTTALAGHNCTFEGSLDSTNGTDGTWFALQALRSNANTIDATTGVLTATPTYSWELSVNGYKYFRIRATAHTSGTATWMIGRGAYATEPIPAAQISGIQPISGSVSVSNVTTFYNDSTANLVAAATFTGTSRDLGVSPQTGKKTFVATAFADQAGTLYVDMSNDSTTFRQAKKQAVAAGDSAELQVAVVTRYYRTRFVNGATAQGAFMINSATIGV